MLRNTLLICVTMLVALSITSTSLAEPQGNDRKGKYTYRKVYKACNKRGAVDSPVPPLSPDTKTMTQWQQVFENRDFDQFGCQDEWQQLEDDDVADIYAYLYKHAADSPTPAKCK